MNFLKKKELCGYCRTRKGIKLFTSDKQQYDDVNSAGAVFTSFLTMFSCNLSADVILAMICLLMLMITLI